MASRGTTQIEKGREEALGAAAVAAFDYIVANPTQNRYIAINTLAEARFVSGVLYVKRDDVPAGTALFAKFPTDPGFNQIDRGKDVEIALVARESSQAGFKFSIESGEDLGFGATAATATDLQGQTMTFAYRTPRRSRRRFAN